MKAKKQNALIEEAASSSSSYSLEGRRAKDDGLEPSIQQRDELYRKARASSKMQGVAGYYASEARAVHAKIKEKQREGQMELFQQANQGNPANKLDLHFLQTGEAMRQLNTFVAERMAASLSSTGTPAHYVHGAEWTHGDLGIDIITIFIDL